MIYFLTMICGLWAVAVFLPLMLWESKQRRQDAIRGIHTEFVGTNCDFVLPISATELTIGRRKRRCDICLIDLIKQKAANCGGSEPFKSKVAQVHARLWWDGMSFRIAPIYRRHLDGTCSKPAVWVNMIPVEKETGMSVDFNDIITISKDMYKFKLVDTSSRYPDLANTHRHPSSKRLVFPQNSISGFTAAKRRTIPNTTTAQNTRKPEKHRRPMSVTTVILAVVALVLVIGSIAISRSMVMPKAVTELGERKKDTATFLLCGVDEGGVRTDTMMLVYVSGSENRIGLLSIPRDTITHTDSGRTVKLNAVYGGRGVEGAEDLMKYVSRYIGYMPDGYMIFDWALVKDITNLMGGIDVELDHFIQVNIDGEDVYIDAGKAHLDGKQALATLRYRYGYVDADLGRVKVQRKVIKACVEQWIALDKIGQVPEALELLREKSITNLDNKNLMWLGKTALLSRGEMSSATLEGYPEYRNGVSYYFLHPRAIVEQINEGYNPYLVDINRENLSVVE